MRNRSACSPLHPLLTLAKIGLQTQSATNPTYAGPWDAIRKIYSTHGVAGIYKGQVVTLWRESLGYGIYFLVYEKLMQREMTRRGIRRDQVNPANAVLFGAAAGYAVRPPPFPLFLLARTLIGGCSCGRSYTR